MRTCPVCDLPIRRAGTYMVVLGNIVHVGQCASYAIKLARRLSQRGQCPPRGKPFAAAIRERRAALA